ncbi:AraC family transcriptional regulator [Subtercola boreus]|nr:helix-turn-helix domain-containing protein [Subtercola boreus]
MTNEPGFTEVQPSRWTLEGWEGLRALGPHLVSENPEGFQAWGRRWSLPGVIISDVAQTPLQMSPSGRDPEQRDYVSIVFVRHGIFELYESGRTFRFEAGQAGYMAGWDQVEAVNPVKSRVAMVSIHRDLLAAHGVTVPGRIGSFPDASRLRRPTLAFLLALMVEFAAAGERPMATEATSTVLAQLLAGLFLEGAGRRSDAEIFPQGLRARAEALIANRSNDPEFSPQVLAEMLNVSLRHLQRSFSVEGVGPAEVIRGKRLETALAALRLASHAPRSVGEIAQQAGFSSVKELRHALRASYGITPRELLAGRPLGSAIDTIDRLSLIG